MHTLRDCLNTAHPVICNARFKAGGGLAGSAEFFTTEDTGDTEKAEENGHLESELFLSVASVISVVQFSPASNQECDHVEEPEQFVADADVH